MSKNLIRFLPALIWMLFIYFLSSQSTSGIRGTYQERFVVLKTFHLIEYAVLFILFFFATRSKKINSFIFTYAYALFDEFHQTFTPGRMGKISDTFIDIVGIMIGYLLITLALRQKHIRHLFT